MRPRPCRRTVGFTRGFTLAEVLIALAILAITAATAAATQLHQRAWVRRAVAQSGVLHLARQELEAVRIAPLPGPCWALTTAERAAGYDCRVEASPCALTAAACAALRSAGVVTLRVVATGPQGARAEVRVASIAPLLGRVTEGR